jgi:hypothetical protein
MGLVGIKIFENIEIDIALILVEGVEQLATLLHKLLEEISHCCSLR